MSERNRKFTYIFESFTEEKYLWLQSLGCKYHIISKCDGELHGFIYLHYGSTECAMQYKFNTEFVFSTYDDQHEISAELKSSGSYWEKGTIPRYVSESAKISSTDKVCNKLLRQNGKLISVVSENYAHMQNRILLLETKNNELQNALLERPVVGSITNSNNNNTITDNTKITNINVFLNTECKNAITLKDFVSKLIVEEEDLESMKQIGYVETVSRLLKRSLNEYEIHERPIHCTDMKREIIHVKDQEGWKRETPLGESPNIDKAFRQITHIHRRKMTDVYKDVDPESSAFEEKAMIMYQIASAGGTEEEKYKKKIMKNISGDIRLPN